MAVSLHIKTLTIAKPGAVTLNVTVAVSEARRLTFVLSGDPNESIRESLSLSVQHLKSAPTIKILSTKTFCGNAGVRGPARTFPDP